ncbi:unnamed protein product, partial [Prorocentrum cordatum]
PPRRRRSPPPRARGAARRGLSGAACGAACVGGLRAPGCGAAGVDAAALGLALALCLSLAKEVGFAGPAGATAAPARKRAALSAEPGGVIGDEARLPEKLLAGVLADPRNFQQRSGRARPRGTLAELSAPHRRLKLEAPHPSQFLEGFFQYVGETSLIGDDTNPQTEEARAALVARAE